MATPGFWAVALALAAVVAAVLVTALRRGGAGGPAANADLAIYKDQLAEIGRDLARGTISAEEAARLHAEVGRRVLEADRAEGQAGPVTVSGGRGTGALAALLVLVLLAGSAAAYWRIGTPGYPDMPLAARLAALDADMAARPSQVQELARIGMTRDDAADAALRDLLAQETDADRLRQGFAARFSAGEIRGAILTLDRLAEVAGDAMTASDHANHALALVAEVQGYVSPEAEIQLRAALTKDLGNEVARYLVGEMFLQAGRFDQTFRFWQPLIEQGNPDAPWVPMIRDRIVTVAGLAGVSYQLPDAVGPDAESLAAAAEMSPEERMAMVEGMVAQLMDRLATEGGSVEDWDRLIRSLAVLERLDQAQSIYDESKVRFEGRPAELSFLRLAAVESGLNP
jgi:cytochrome c-type biogenesis protein CcmH